jgi:hypothetical protein
MTDVVDDSDTGSDVPSQDSSDSSLDIEEEEVGLSSAGFIVLTAYVIMRSRRLPRRGSQLLMAEPVGPTANDPKI